MFGNPVELATLEWRRQMPALVLAVFARPRVLSDL